MLRLLYIPGCVDCAFEDGQDWAKHVGASFNTALLYFMLYYVGFIAVNSAEGTWSKCTYKVSSLASPQIP
jgi:hypothetical protein